VLRTFDPRQEGVPYGGRPDGACVDAEGAYWCALYEGARVLRLSPCGEVLAELPVPAERPTMPCLGGPDGRTLFVTCAQGPVLCTRVDVPGLPVAWCELGGVR
jgi:sugar lactone lactonase YvrE